MERLLHRNSQTAAPVDSATGVMPARRRVLRNCACNAADRLPVIRCPWSPWRGEEEEDETKGNEGRGTGWRQCVTETPPSAPRTSAGCGRWLHSIITTICGHTLRTALDQRALLVESRRTEATLQTSACSNEQIIVISSYLGLP